MITPPHTKQVTNTPYCHKFCNLQTPSASVNNVHEIESVINNPGDINFDILEYYEK